MALWIPAAIAAAASLVGGERRNVAASAQAQRQMAFQERMSSTAHQREVKDLRAAGLNPVLSATGGSGASSPGGAQAPVQDIVSPAVNSALAARRMAQEIRNLEAVELKTRADTVQTEHQTSVLSGPAGIGDWIGTMIDEFNRVSPTLGPLARGGFKIRKDQLEDFMRSSAQGARELRGRITRWIQENLQRRGGSVRIRPGRFNPGGSSDR